MFSEIPEKSFWYFAGFVLLADVGNMSMWLSKDALALKTVTEGPPGQSAEHSMAQDSLPVLASSITP